MRTPEDKQVLEEAVMLFLRVDETPDDVKLKQELSEFLARGQAEQAAYKKAVAGWQAAGIKPRRNKMGMAVLLVLFGGAVFYSAEPLRIAMVADMSTRSETFQDSLKSGDLVFLDAGSAIVDNTGPTGSSRSISVLKGAAFFEVTPDARPFRVTLGDITVEAVGTAFETSYMDDGLSVAVEEGIVRVTSETGIWQLEAGERLRWSDDAAELLPEVAPEAVAQWRQDQLVARNMSVAQVAAILDRRISGDVVIMGQNLANKTVSGSFDLSDPMGALEVLAATQNAGILPGRPLVTILMPRD